MNYSTDTKSHQKQIQLPRRFYFGKNNENETPEDHWRNTIEFEKDEYPAFSKKTLDPKFIRFTTDEKFRDKLIKWLALRIQD